MARKPGRPRTSDELLSRERILDTALAMIDAYGVDTFSMRRLAAALGVDPMALYHYVPNKRALLSALVEQVMAGLNETAFGSGVTWEIRLLTAARAYYDVVRAHPNLMFTIVGDSDLTAQSFQSATSEQLYAALFDAGLEPVQVVDGVSVIVDYLHGYVLGDHAVQGGDYQPIIERIEAQLTDDYPNTRRAMQTILSKPISESFAFERGLNIILAGIKTMLP